MAKFINSSESITSSMLLWNDVPTQVSIQETFDIKVWPITNILNEGPINFQIPPQPKGLMTDIFITTKLKVLNNGQDITSRQDSLSVVNNFANSIWGQVDIQVDDRVDITQSMKNAYAYQTFFNHVLNSESNRTDYLFYNELFKMDVGETKIKEENSRKFWEWNNSIEDEIKNVMPENRSDEQKDGTLKSIKVKMQDSNLSDLYDMADQVATIIGYTDGSKTSELVEILGRARKPTAHNPAASDRSRFINKGDSVTLSSKLQCPLFNTSKCLPSNMKIRISLSKNNDEFVLLSNDNAKFSIYIEDCYLEITYYRPRDAILNLIEERIQKEPAPYFVTRPELIIKPITNGGKVIRISDVFHDTLPAYAFFCLQRSKDFEGTYKTNPYTFIPFQKFQFYLNGSPYFMDPLEVSMMKKMGDGHYKCTDFGDYMRQLYKTIGKDLKGDCLINSSNFQLNFMVGMSFGADRSSLGERHLNLQEKGSTYLEIDMGVNDNIPGDLILIIYAVYDRQIQIDANRKIQIIE